MHTHTYIYIYVYACIHITQAFSLGILGFGSGCPGIWGLRGCGVQFSDSEAQDLGLRAFLV